MDEADRMEKLLREKLVPRGFSERGMASMASLLDELEAESPVMRPRRVWPWAAAAASCALAALAMWRSEQPAEPLIAVVPHEAPGSMELVSETVGVVAADEEGELVTEADGTLLRAWHMQVVNEERFHDPETGHEVRVVSPVDEVVLVPVSSF